MAIVHLDLWSRWTKNQIFSTGKIKRTYPLQNGSENPLDLTAVKFLASLINTCSWPLSPGIFGFFTFFLVGDGVGTSLFTFSGGTYFKHRIMSPLYVKKEVGCSNCENKNILNAIWKYLFYNYTCTLELTEWLMK